MAGQQLRQQKEIIIIIIIIITLTTYAPQLTYTSLYIHFNIHFYLITLSVVSTVPRPLDGRSGVQTPAGGNTFISPPKRPDLLWGPPRLLYNGHWRSFPDLERPMGKVNRLHLLPRLRMSGAMPLLPLHNLMAWTRTTPNLKTRSLDQTL
jgi:hypothetical protein